MLSGAAPAGRLDVDVEGLRNASGQVRLCLTRNPDHFPNCKTDPAALRLAVAAGAVGRLAFADLPSGDYALSVIHDENGNRKLDTFARIPREGFGFSRNPAIRLGPPRFADARFGMAGQPVRQEVIIRYIL